MKSPAIYRMSGRLLLALARASSARSTPVTSPNSESRSHSQPEPHPTSMMFRWFPHSFRISPIQRVATAACRRLTSPISVSRYSAIHRFHHSRCCSMVGLSTARLPFLGIPSILNVRSSRVQGTRCPLRASAGHQVTYAGATGGSRRVWCRDDRSTAILLSSGGALATKWLRPASRARTATRWPRCRSSMTRLVDREPIGRTSILTHGRYIVARDQERRSRTSDPARRRGSGCDLR